MGRIPQTIARNSLPQNQWARNNPKANGWHLYLPPPQKKGVSQRILHVLPCEGQASISQLWLWPRTDAQAPVCKGLSFPEPPGKGSAHATLDQPLQGPGESGSACRRGKRPQPPWAIWTAWPEGGTEPEPPLPSPAPSVASRHTSLPLLSWQ